MAKDGTKILVTTTKRCWYGKQLRYPADDDHDRAGEPFFIREDAFRRGPDGKVLLDKEGRPLLPKWAKRLSPAREAEHIEKLAEEEVLAKKSLARKPKKSSGDEDVL